MNRIVLIGNGFDIAHGLKTSYADFINWYWSQWGKRLAGSGNNREEDEFCSFAMNDIGHGGWYLVRGWYYRSINMDLAEFIKNVRNDSTLCDFKYTSSFLRKSTNA